MFFLLSCISSYTFNQTFSIEALFSTILLCIWLPKKHIPEAESLGPATTTFEFRVICGKNVISGFNTAYILMDKSI